MKYWDKLKRECAGFYYAESNYANDILRIFKIDRKTWGYCFGNGMTKGTFTSFREAKNYFNF